MNSNNCGSRVKTDREEICTSRHFYLTVLEFLWWAVLRHFIMQTGLLIPCISPWTRLPGFPRGFPRIAMEIFFNLLISKAIFINFSACTICPKIAIISQTFRGSSMTSFREMTLNFNWSNQLIYVAYPTKMNSLSGFLVKQLSKVRIYATK